MCLRMANLLSACVNVSWQLFLTGHRCSYQPWHQMLKSTPHIQKVNLGVIQTPEGQGRGHGLTGGDPAHLRQSVRELLPVLNKRCAGQHVIAPQALPTKCSWGLLCRQAPDLKTCSGMPAQSLRGSAICWSLPQANSNMAEQHTLASVLTLWPPSF